MTPIGEALVNRTWSRSSGSQGGRVSTSHLAIKSRGSHH